MDYIIAAMISARIDMCIRIVAWHGMAWHGRWLPRYFVCMQGHNNLNLHCLDAATGIAGVLDRGEHQSSFVQARPGVDGPAACSH